MRMANLTAPGLLGVETENGIGAGIGRQLFYMGSFSFISSTCVALPAWQAAPIEPAVARNRDLQRGAGK
jgi:hypothetical protein